MNSSRPLVNNQAVLVNGGLFMLDAAWIACSLSPQTSRMGKVRSTGGGGSANQHYPLVPEVEGQERQEQQPGRSHTPWPTPQMLLHWELLPP